MASDEYYDDYDDYDDGERGSWLVRVAGLAVVGLGVFAFVWFGLLSGGDDGNDNQQLTSADVVSPPVDEVEPATTDPDGAPVGADNETAEDGESVEDAASDDATELDVDTADEQLDTTDDDDVGAAGDEGVASGADPAEVDAPAPTALDATEPAPIDASAPAPTEVSYPTLPDGSPAPVLAIYDGELITLSGVVPSEESAQRLSVLAVANSTVPGAEVASFLRIDPTVPLGVGVRVIEMNSARFPEGSPTVSPEHAAQLDRIVAVMSSLPHLTVDVIGHADQRGDEETNFQLSADRARAAADYVASRGIDPSRLSARGAGESDLLTLNNDAAALALNRRTEFVFFGLLVDPPAPNEETETS